jgi:hypothetical protein
VIKSGGSSYSSCGIDYIIGNLGASDEVLVHHTAVVVDYLIHDLSRHDLSVLWISYPQLLLLFSCVGDSLLLAGQLNLVSDLFSRKSSIFNRLWLLLQIHLLNYRLRPSNQGLGPA